MQLHDLKPSEGSRRPARRVGRGHGSGRGKTSGRGQKGQNARSEGFRLGFEGGQMPFAQRIPKLPGFKSRFKKLYEVVNLSKLSRFEDGTKVDPELMIKAGIAKPGKDIKVLGAGGLNRKLEVEAHAFSSEARAAIEKRGGTVKVLGEPRTKGPRRTAAAGKGKAQMKAAAAAAKGGAKAAQPADGKEQAPAEPASQEKEAPTDKE